MRSSIGRAAQRRSGRRSAAGFTLVELLVVITIIGVLVGLLIPAVQSAREAGRRTTCKNHLRQLGLACQLHESRHGFLPTGGWAWGWAGDPDRGFTNKQPGGWLYNILPFIEQEQLHDLGANGTNRTQGKQRAQKSLALFHCPTRRRAIPYPFVNTDSYLNIDRPNRVGRCDYAACAGDVVADDECGWKGEGAEELSESEWASQPGCHTTATGVIHRRSMVRFPHIQDGESCTYLLGEKYVCPDNYTNGQGLGSDQGWDLGYDYDNNRWTEEAERCRPRRDQTGVDEYFAFGSAHSAGFNVVFCDGSVQTMAFSIDPQAHAYLGNRADGANIDPAKF